ncbi:MAG: hypothetical protein JWO81_1391 [Alphaproteobacteria bacterium]|nr:hypothetical protein [Alphaproteobacteria bacterium]
MELSIPPGIFSDDTSFASEQRWIDGSNVRFVEGMPQATGQDGGALYVAFPNCYGIFSRGTTLMFTSSGTLRLGGAPTTDVTPASSWTVKARPTFANWGSTILVNPTDGSLYQQNGTAVATLITQAPVQITTILVTPERQVLALGCNEEVSGTFNALCIRGCDLEDFTNWTTTSADNAFEHVLEGGNSAVIVAARMVGNYVAVLTSRSLYLGQYLGDPGQTYRFDKVDENCGCIALNAVTVVDGTLYWLGTDCRLRAWEPGTLPRVIPCPIFRDFFTYCDTNYAANIYLTYLTRWGEVRIAYPDTRDGLTDCTRHITYSPRESQMAQRPVWYRGTGKYTAMFDDPLFPATVGALYGIFSSGPAYVDQGPNAAGAGGGASSWSIKTGDRYLDSGRRRVTVQGINQDHTPSPAAVSLNLYMKNRPLSSTVLSIYDISTGNKKDFRASGMIAAIEFAGTGAWRLGKPVFRCTTMGER